MSERVYVERYWRDAKPEDASKEPPMVARFDNDKTPQGIDRLTGFRRLKDGSILWYAEDGRVGSLCQVYDAPDPGEGWRLIDIDKDDYRQNGVEYWNKKGQEWTDRSACKYTPFLSDIFYRIRITPTVTYVPFTWEDREQLRGRWVTRDNQELQLVNLDNSDGFFANGVHVVNLCVYWKFLDTGKPVGKEVVQ